MQKIGYKIIINGKNSMVIRAVDISGAERYRAESNRLREQARLQEQLMKSKQEERRKAEEELFDALRDIVIGMKNSDKRMSRVKSIESLQGNKCSNCIWRDCCITSCDNHNKKAGVCEQNNTSEQNNTLHDKQSRGEKTCKVESNQGRADRVCEQLNNCSTCNNTCNTCKSDNTCKIDSNCNTCKSDNTCSNCKSDNTCNNCKTVTSCNNTKQSTKQSMKTDKTCEKAINCKSNTQCNAVQSNKNRVNRLWKQAKEENSGNGINNPHAVKVRHITNDNGHSVWGKESFINRWILTLDKEVAHKLLDYWTGDDIYGEFHSLSDISKDDMTTEFVWRVHNSSIIVASIESMARILESNHIRF